MNFKKVVAPTDIGREASEKFLGLMADASHYDEIYGGENIEIIHPTTGESLAKLASKAVSLEDCKAAWKVLKNVELKSRNRGTSSGMKRLSYVRNDGVLSKTHITEPVNSGVIGFYDRYPRTPYCRKCAWNQQHEEQYKAIVPLFQKVNEIHKTCAPVEHARQMETVNQTKKDWIIPNTAYSTITINKNYRTGFHYDGKNMAGGFSAMLYMRSGQLSGGHIVFPRYRFAVSFDIGDVIMFNGQDQIHGNTALSLMTTDAQRCTLVHYFREKMKNCLSKEEELQRAKNFAGGQLYDGCCDDDDV